MWHVIDQQDKHLFIHILAIIEQHVSDIILRDEAIAKNRRNSPSKKKKKIDYRTQNKNS